MNILIVNGPNLNMLGIREPDVYGKKTYKDLVTTIKAYARNQGCFVKIYQSNHEGKIIDYIQKKYLKFDGIIINPGAFTHYSYAIRDCLSAIDLPKIEVHLSNILEREDFRKISVIKDVVNQTVMGKGFDGYIEAMDIVMKLKS
jgi:3-dehydroquinate dehydratase-2